VVQPCRCREGDWIRADGTTLGADNGVGVVTALALLDMPAAAQLPPLACSLWTRRRA
jgi:dipeptidase D